LLYSRHKGGGWRIECNEGRRLPLLDIGDVLLVRHRAIYSFVCVMREKSGSTKSVINKNLE
jgi:hypothetical protein